MTARILRPSITILLFLSAALLPWYCTAALALGGIIYFPWFIEASFVGWYEDVVYSAGSHTWVVGCVFLILLAAFVRQYIRS